MRRPCTIRPEPSERTMQQDELEDSHGRHAQKSRPVVHSPSQDPILDHFMYAMADEVRRIGPLKCREGKQGGGRYTRYMVRLQ